MGWGKQLQGQVPASGLAATRCCCFWRRGPLKVSELCLLESGSAFGSFLSSERGCVSASIPVEQEPCSLLKVSLEHCSAPCLSLRRWCASLAGAQVVEKISLPYFATSLSLSPAARFMAVGFSGEYWRELGALPVPGLPFGVGRELPFLHVGGNQASSWL